MPFNIFIVPLIAGYVFITVSPYHKAKFDIYDGQRLVFGAALWGFLFFVLAFILAHVLHGLDKPIIKAWHKQIKTPYLGISIFSFGIGVFITGIVRLFTKKTEGNVKKHSCA